MTSNNPISITSSPERMDLTRPSSSSSSSASTTSSSSSDDSDNSLHAGLTMAELRESCRYYVGVLREQRERHDVERNQEQLRHRAELVAANNALLRAKTEILNLQREIKKLEAAKKA